MIPDPATATTGTHVLPALIGRFKEKYPDIQVSLFIGDRQLVVECVLEGRMEVGLAGRGSALNTVGLP